MPLVTKCGQCQRPLQVPENAAGKPVRCPYCQQVFTAGRAGGVSPLLNDSNRGLTPPARQGCPACGAALLPGAIACMDCGYLLRPEPDARAEEPPSLCTNPACG